MTPLKFVSINIEGSAHLDLVTSFCLAQKPDVINLQEVFAADFDHLCTTFGMTGFFVPMALVQDSPTGRHFPDEWGVAQFTRLSEVRHSAKTYVSHGEVLPDFYDRVSDNNAMNRVLSWMEINHQGQLWRFATTHFVWSSRGQYTNEQVAALSAMKQVLAQQPDLVLSGDFNSPRRPLPGEETNAFNQLAALYHDNIPPEVTTSIDGQFHKAGQLELMVDGLFTTPEYRCHNVAVVGGVSDHKAIVAEVERVASLG